MNNGLVIQGTSNPLYSRIFPALPNGHSSSFYRSGNQAIITERAPAFLPIAVFPLIFAAALYGGWWIVGPFVFFMIVGPLDLAFGEDGRNMDLKATSEHPLFWYNLSVWLWALLWPTVFVFTLWQIFIVGDLTFWEGTLMAIVLAVEGQGVFIVGHEMIHRRTTWERYIGEFLLASVSYPYYATEHFYIHHAHVGTPKDRGSAPKGQSFWSYLPGELASNITGAWKVERDRMTHRQLPIWHFSNPFWRYGLETAAWYALVYFMGGWQSVLIFMFLCFGIVFSMKISNYIQHYGLRRVRLPNGRFERVRPRHSWGADYQFSNWMFFNMQRHPDHHVSAGRRYPLLQHHSAEESPLLPGSYGTMFGLALRPKRFFKTMDPLVDQWREQFYPAVDDWSAYDSPVSGARPEAFDAISEIFATAPRLARAIERNPELLDSLQSKEFTDLEIPGGFGPDPEFERIARCGLARIYWTHEFGVSEMKDQIAEIPMKDSADAADIVRNWSNHKTFQVGMHTLRGNLTPTEAGVALANISESAICAILQAVVEDAADRDHLPDEGGVAAIVLGDLASREVAPDTPLGIMFVHEGDSTGRLASLCRRFHEALRKLTRASLLFESPSKKYNEPVICGLENLTQHHQDATTGDLAELTRVRCVFTCGNSDVRPRFDDARHAALSQDTVRDEFIQLLHNEADNQTGDDASLTACMQQGTRNVERAAQFLQLTRLEQISDNPNNIDATSVFQAARALDLIPEEAAEQLTRAAQVCRNLRGIHQLVMEDGVPTESMSDKAKTVIAKSCGQVDFDQLYETVRETVTASESGLSSLIAQET